MHDVNFGSRFQTLHRKMRGGANARRGVVEWRFLGGFNQLWQCFGSHTGVDRKDVGRFRAQRYGRKVFQSVVTSVCIKRRIDRKGHAVNQDGVAIGCRAFDLAGRNVATRTAFVVYNEITTREFIQLLSQ